MQYKPIRKTNNLQVLRFSWRCNRQLQYSGMLYWIAEDLNPLLHDWLSDQLASSFWRSEKPQCYWKHSNLNIHNNRPYSERDESHIQNHFNIILPTTSSSKWFFPSRLSDLNFSPQSHLYTNDKQQINRVYNAGATLKMWQPLSWLQNPHPPQLLWNLKVHYYIHNSLPQHALLSRMKPVHSGNPYFLTINIFVFSQTEQYFIIQLIGNTFRSLRHHQAI